MDVPDQKLFLRSLAPVRLMATTDRWPPGEGRKFELLGGPVKLVDTAGTPVVEVSALVLSSVLSQRIEIHPGSGKLPIINVGTEGVVPVALLSSRDFNAPSLVNPASLRFGRTGQEASLALRGSQGTPQCIAGDVNGDGVNDLLCHFEIEKTGLKVDTVEAVLTGRTFGGNLIVGRKFFRVPPGK